MFCIECGTNLPPTAKFCSGCGVAVSQSQPSKESVQVAESSQSAPVVAQPQKDVSTPTPASIEKKEVKVAGGKIQIEMESQPFLLSIGKIQVLIDGKVVSSDLWFGKTIELSIADASSHKLQIQLKSILTRSSDVLTFKVESGQMLKFEGIYGNITGGVSLVQV